MVKQMMRRSMWDVVVLLYYHSQHWWARSDANCLMVDGTTRGLHTSYLRCRVPVLTKWLWCIYYVYHSLLGSVQRFAWSTEPVYKYGEVHRASALEDNWVEDRWCIMKLECKVTSWIGIKDHWNTLTNHTLEGNWDTRLFNFLEVWNTVAIKVTVKCWIKFISQPALMSFMFLSDTILIFVSRYN